MINDPGAEDSQHPDVSITTYWNEILSDSTGEKKKHDIWVAKEAANI